MKVEKLGRPKIILLIFFRAFRSSDLGSKKNLYLFKPDA